jgi:hypothetical protein
MEFEAKKFLRVKLFVSCLDERQRSFSFGKTQSLMNRQLFPLVRFTIFVSAWLFGANLDATPDNNTIVASQGGADALQLAYSTLAEANHNYFGHRKAAMKQVQAAAQLLGIDLQGDGQGKEEQNQSDTQLAQVQQLLQQLGATLTSEEQKPVLEHIDKAVKRISMALMDRTIEEGK